MRYVDCYVAGNSIQIENLSQDSGKIESNGTTYLINCTSRPHDS